VVPSTLPLHPSQADETEPAGDGERGPLVRGRLWTASPARRAGGSDEECGGPFSRVDRLEPSKPPCLGASVAPSTGRHATPSRCGSWSRLASWVEVNDRGAPLFEARPPWGVSGRCRRGVRSMAGSCGELGGTSPRGRRLARKTSSTTTPSYGCIRTSSSRRRR
jgi:hypothetical protein